MKPYIISIQKWQGQYVFNSDNNNCLSFFADNAIEADAIRNFIQDTLPLISLIDPNTKKSIRQYQACSIEHEIGTIVSVNFRAIK